MEDNGKLAELAESVMILREDVKRADDTLAGMGEKFRDFTRFYTTESRSSDRIRSRMIDFFGLAKAPADAW